MTFAGFPAAIALSGILFTTTEPAPIVTLLPILTFPIIVTFAPKETLLPIVGLPFEVAPIVVH